MSAGIIDSLLPAVNSILGVRDAAGAVIDPIYFVTRTWTGAEIGEGTASEVVVQMLPSPGLKNYSQDVRLREGGVVKQGDIILTNVSRYSYQEADLDGSSTGNNVEVLYLVGVKLYQPINIFKNYLTWNVQLRELTNQQRY